MNSHLKMSHEKSENSLIFGIFPVSDRQAGRWGFYKWADYQDDGFEAVAYSGIGLLLGIIGFYVGVETEFYTD